MSFFNLVDELLVLYEAVVDDNESSDVGVIINVACLHTLVTHKYGFGGRQIFRELMFRKRYRLVKYISTNQ